jgi:hypothetical protein
MAQKEKRANLENLTENKFSFVIREALDGNVFPITF